MGHGSYTASDWAKLKNSRGISGTSNVDQLFRNKRMDDKYNPRFIEMRESCDSEDSPQSTPIIIGFDDTGSMGYLAEEIAINSLNKTVTQIYEKQPVTNPHIMCAAFGNKEDMAPLQVTQFEADIRVVEQLLDLWIERRGQGYSGDILVWYFAAKHTKIDSFDKRGKKGFLFTIGDDICSRNIDPKDGRLIFHDDINAISKESLIQMASEKYELFHIITKPLRHTAFEEWNKLLPGRVAMLDADGVKYLSEVIISIMQLTNGMNRSTVVDQWSEEAKGIVREAIKFVNPVFSQGETFTTESIEKTSWFEKYIK